MYRCDLLPDSDRSWRALGAFDAGRQISGQATDCWSSRRVGLDNHLALDGSRRQFGGRWLAKLARLDMLGRFGFADGFHGGELDHPITAGKTTLGTH